MMRKDDRGNWWVTEAELKVLARPRIRWWVVAAAPAGILTFQIIAWLLR